MRIRHRAVDLPETSRGKTQDYNIEIKQINANHRKESITLETTGNTIHSELHRKNPVAEYMASFDPTGLGSKLT